MNRKNAYAILAVMPLVIVFYLSNRYMDGVQLFMAEGYNIVQAVDSVWRLICDKPFYISTQPLHLFGSCGTVLVLIMVANIKTGRKFRVNEEHGSARWGNAKDIAPYIDPIPDNNIILTKTVNLTMESRPVDPELSRNKNVLVMGGAGSGKTRGFVKPNIMQCHSSYVITDPKGTVMEECGKMLEENGYVIKVLDINGARGMQQSQHYNPLAYITCEADILQVVDVLMENTQGEGERSGEKFWTDAERLYYCALIGYLWIEGKPEEQNFSMLIKFLEASISAEEEAAAYDNAVDILFKELEEKQPDCFAVRQYRKFKLAPVKTTKNILISCGARLAPFDIGEVRELMAYDELELDTLGDKRKDGKKVAMFVITSDTNKTFNFIAAMMYSQMFNLLCDRALYEYGGRLPVHVRCILDEFANIGKIPNFENLISVIRSREISACIILQSRAQLESVYDKKTDIIIDNCDSMLFLGGRGVKNLEEISKLLGRETISEQDESTSRGRDRSDSSSVKNMGRELMTIDELAVLRRGQCICQISGLRPFLSDKYDITQHPRYPLLSDADKSNKYIPNWVKLSQPPTPDEEFYYDEEECSQ